MHSISKGAAIILIVYPQVLRLKRINSAVRREDALRHLGGSRGFNASHMVCLRMWLVIVRAVELGISAAPPKLPQDRQLLLKTLVPGLKRRRKKTNKQKEFIKFKAKPFNVKACNKALEASSLDNEATSLLWVSVVERSGFFQFMSETECLWQRCEFRSLAGEIAELCGKCLHSLMLLMVEQTAFLALKPFWVYICFHQSLVNDMIIAHHLQMFLT